MRRFSLRGAPLSRHGPGLLRDRFLHGRAASACQGIWWDFSCSGAAQLTSNSLNTVRGPIPPLRERKCVCVSDGASRSSRYAYASGHHTHQDMCEPPSSERILMIPKGLAYLVLWCCIFRADSSLNTQRSGNKETGGHYVSREETKLLSIRESYPGPLMALSQRFRSCMGTPKPVLSKSPGACTAVSEVAAAARRPLVLPRPRSAAGPPSPWPCFASTPRDLVGL